MSSDTDFAPSPTPQSKLQITSPPLRTVSARQALLGLFDTAQSAEAACLRAAAEIGS